MKKFFLGFLITVIFAANFSICQATKISLYDYSAKNLLDEITHDIEYELSEEFFPYVIKNFRLLGDIDEETKETFELQNLQNKNFKVYGCDLIFKTSETPNGMMLFISDDQEKTFLVAISAFLDKNTSQNQQLELFRMMMLTTSLVFHSIMTESEMELLIQDITKNTNKGKWGIWHDEKYINCSIGKNDEMFLCVIDATDSKN